MSTSADTGRAKRPALRRPAGIRLGAVLAFGIAVGAIAFFLLRDDDGGSNSESVATPPAAVETRAPEVVSLATLQSRASEADQPIYWAGRVVGRRYELTETPDGSRIYVRYLPQNASVGARRPFLTVATYRMSNAFKATEAVSKLDGSTPIPVADGGVAFYSQDQPTSVYLAYPDANYQIEVFHPRPDIAHQLVRSGQIRPLDAN
jgi:hypothetical protein